MANYVSGSAAKFLVNGQMVGGLTMASTSGSFAGLPGGQSGSIAEGTLDENIRNNNLISALNSIYESASGNEPAGNAESVQFRNGGDFGGDASVILDVSAGSLTVNATSGSMGGHHLGFSGSLALDTGTIFNVDNAGALTANSLKTDGSEFVVSSAGAITAVTSIDASGLASLDGGINTNDDFTVDTDGNIVGVAGTLSGLASLDGGINVADKFTVATGGAIAVDTDKFTVSAAGAVVAASTITGASGSFGALGATTVAGSGAGTFGGTVTGASGSFGALGATTVAGSGAGTFGGTVTGTSGSFGGVGATTLAASSTADVGGLASLDGGINTNDDFTVDTDGNVVGVAGTFSGLASLDGGINTNDDFTVDTDGNIVGVAGTLSGLASLDGGINVADKFTVATGGAIAVDTNKFTVSAAGAVVAASTINSSAGITGSVGGTFGTVISTGAISGGGDATISGIVSGSGVTAVTVVGDTLGNQGGQFSVSTIGNLGAAGITGSSLTDSTATLQAGTLTNLTMLEFQDNGIIDGHPTGSLRIGNAMVQSTKVTLSGISGSTSLVQAESARNNVYGDWNMSFGAMYYQGYPNATAGTFAQSRPSLVLSASSYAAQKQTQGNAAAFAAIPYLQLQGVDHAGTTQDYKIQISGGILQLTVVT